MVLMRNIAGQIFGAWRVKKRVGVNKDGRATWDCYCTICGFRKVISGKALLQGKNRHCSNCHSKAKNEIGKKFGYLRVIKQLDSDKHGFAVFLCRCEFLTEKVIKGSLLTVACGKEIRVKGISLRKKPKGQEACRSCSTKIFRKAVFQDLSGRQFGRLHVIDLDKVKSNEKHTSYWRCKCECDAVRSIRQDALLSGKTKSCGCLHRELAGERGHAKIKHGLTDQPIYSVYQNIIRRCYDPKCKAYSRYGGRSIKVCLPWREDICEFSNWAFVLGWKPGMTIDRKDNDGDYCPENCQIITRCEHALKTHSDRGTAFLLEGNPIAIRPIAKKSNVTPNSVRTLLAIRYNEKEIVEIGKLEFHQRRYIIQQARKKIKTDISLSKNIKKIGSYSKPPLGKSSYRAMLSRCYNQNNLSFRYYGSKCIGVCPEWILGGYDRFILDMGLPPEGSYHIDRLFVDRDYSPQNCRWVTASENSKRRKRQLSKEEFALSGCVPAGNLLENWLEEHGVLRGDALNIIRLGVRGLKKYVNNLKLMQE